MAPAGRLLALLARPLRPAAMAQPRCFALELPGGGLAHFAVGAAGSGGADPDPDPDPRAAALLGPPGRSYALLVPGAPGADLAARVRAARLLRRLLPALRRGPLGRCERLRLLGYRPGGGGGLQRGLLLRDPGAGPATRRALLALLDSCLEAPRPSLGEFGGEFGGAGLRLWQRPWELRGGREWRQAEPERVVAAPEPALHPAVPDLPRAAVFPHREAARAVLEACTPFLPAAGAVLELVDRCPRQLPRGPFPVIVVEGLDATGKTTVTRALADALGAALLRSPPAGLSPWRQAFDEEPDMVRRAFYSLGNYIAASEIAAASARAPVVVDRFWHSTAAYAIATEVSGAVQHLPPARHPIYQWPKDLLRPDLVVLLTVSPEERRERIRGRGLERTAEEEELEASSTFRQKVEACYERMEDPGCHAVDASPSREQVLQAVLGLVRDRCPQLP